MANENVIQATFDGFYKTYTEPSWFIDHGMELSISGIDLPAEFECHFSNSRSVAANRQIGENGVVTIPDEYFLSNAPQIFCWIYLHPTVDSGVTEYEIVIPLRTRPNVDPAEPTQEQQDIVDQAIAALNVAMAATSADAESASASATAAQAAVDSVLNMTVSADTLPAGADASVTKSVVDDAVHLAFGIPQGVQGEQGEQGPTGATPNFTIGTVHTLLPTQDATVTITGTAEAPVLNFGIPKGYSGDANNLAADYSSNKTYAVGEYCIYNGSLYRCNTAITTAEAWTAAHWTAAVLGDDVGDLKSAVDGLFVEGENLFNPDIAREKIGYWVRSTTGVPYYDGDNTYGISDYIQLDGVSPYTVLVASRIWLYDADKTYIRSISTASPIAVPAGTSYIIVGCKIATVGNTTVAKGENVTEPIPYEAPFVNPDVVKVDSTLTEAGIPADAKTVGEKFKDSPLNKNDVCYFGSAPVAYYSGLMTDYSADGFGRTTDYQTLIGKFDSLVDGYYATKVDKGLSSDGTTHLFEYDFAPPASTLTNKEKALPTVLIISGLHGFEKASIYGLYYFLKDLKENWTSNPILDYLHHHVLLKIIPCCNPYGFNNNTYWNANGVNLNRNFATSGWSLNGEPFTSEYSGPTANSENETKIVSAFIEDNPDAIIFVDFHTNGQYAVSTFDKVNWFDFANLSDAFFKEFEYLACSHVETITAHFNEEYSLGLTSQLCGYVTSGLYESIPTSDIYALEHGVLGHTMEGFTGFPNGQEFSAGALKGNSELIGNWIAEVAYKYGNLI